MWDALVSAGLKDVEESNDIRIDVVARMRKAMPHTGLRREVDHPVETLLKCLLDGGLVCEIGANKTPIALGGGRRLGKKRETGLFQRRIIVVIDHIEADDFVTALDKPLGGVKADKTRGTRYEYSHDDRTLSSLSRPLQTLRGRWQELTLIADNAML